MECAKCGIDISEGDFHISHEQDGMDTEYFCSEVCFNTYHDDPKAACRPKSA